MRRSLALLCAAAVGATGLAVSTPVAAASAAPSSPSAAAAVPQQLLVGYRAGATAADRERARERASAQREEQVVQARADRTEVELVRIPQGKDRDAAIAELESDPAVAYAEPNWIYTHQTKSTDPYYVNNELWGMYGDLTDPANRFGSAAGEAWAAGKTGSSSVYVGVIDEGIQFDHPDLDGQVWTNPAEPVDGVDNDVNGYVDDVRGWDFDGNDNTIYDGGTKGSLDDHGTHVAGTIGAKNGSGDVVGVNWNVTMISGKFLGRRGGTLANAVKAVDYFTDLKIRHGLNIVATNNSWGGGGFSQALLDAIIRGAKQNILFVAAAGNNGSDNDSTESYPSNYDTTNTASTTEPAATYDAVIAVAAIDRAGALASFSQYGATTVDLGAPGVGIWSTTAYNGYSQYNGTSMATPHVTGAVALYAAANPLETSAKNIRDALLGSTNPTASLAGKTVTGGRLDADRMISGAPATAEPAPEPEPAPLDVTLTAGPKKQNVTPVTATWTTGFTGEYVDVTRSGSTFATENDGELTENWRGSGTVTYTICETGSTTRCASESITI